MLKQNKPRSVTLRVTRSGTKTNTLMEYVPGEPMPRELGGALFLNAFPKRGQSRVLSGSGKGSRNAHGTGRKNRILRLARSVTGHN